jgi:hypothetical protein
MTEAVANSIPGSRYVLMQGMGHFPMIENYPGFRPYLLDALNHVAPAAAGEDTFGQAASPSGISGKKAPAK